MIKEIWPKLVSISNAVWMQDNASIHSAKIVEKHFEETNFPKLVWPARSADLNPIENVWGIMVRMLDKMIESKKEATSEDELFKRVETCSKQIESTIFQNLFKSMPKRMESVIKKNGHCTKY